MSTLTTQFNHLFATKDFYKKVSFIALPIAFQHFLNSAMGLVDSIMVARINQVTAVGTAVQLEILMMTISYGAASGAAIYIAQFFGANDKKNQRQAFSFGVMLVGLIALFWFLSAALFGESLLGFYIKDQQVIKSSLSYLNVAMFSYFPFAFTMMFSFAYRSIQKTIVPMMIGIFSMSVNVFLNYSLIFGHFGFPQLGVVGAAWATLIAHSVALIIHLVYGISSKQPFLGKLGELFGFTKQNLNKMWNRTIPLVINEIFFGIGMTLFIRFYGHLGKEAMDSYYVSHQINQAFMFIVMGINAATGSILGAQLGKGEIEEARKTTGYFVGIGLVISMMMIAIIIIMAPIFVGFYGLNNEDIIQSSILIVRIMSLRLGLRMFNVMIFSSLRAGGDSNFLTFLDAGLLWMIGLPLAYLLVYGLAIQQLAWILLIVQSEQIIRLLIGTKRIKQGVWAKNLTHEIQ